MSTVEIVLLLVSWVFFLSLGFILGFYWLKTQLESKMMGMFDLEDDLEFGNEGDLFDEQ